VDRLAAYGAISVFCRLMECNSGDLGGASRPQEFHLLYSRQSVVAEELSLVGLSEWLLHPNTCHWI